MTAAGASGDLGAASAADVELAQAIVSLDGEAAAGIVAAISDVAIVVDAQGTIRSARAGNNEALSRAIVSWVGRRWVDTVTSETRSKIDLLLRDAAAGGSSPRRQVNHITAEGDDLPVSYAAVRLAQDGMVLAAGRDLRAVSVLQKRLVETQQAMERDYWKLRSVETRYRLLFQLSDEAVLIVDAGTRQIVDANAAALRALDLPAERLLGQPFPVGVDAAAAATLGELLGRTRAAGRAEPVIVELQNGREMRASASFFRQDSATMFLVRLVPVGDDWAPSGVGASVSELLANAPDGFVVTTLAGDVLQANQTFLDIAQIGSEEHARGRSISEWIGRPGADLGVMLETLRQHGVVRLLATTAHGEHGNATEVEVSAVWAPDAPQPCIGFLVRDIGRRVAMGAQGARDLTRAVEQLTDLVGRTSLPDLLRDTVDLVERHFIEAALELTHDNRTAAAEVLGLSRQSLYVKLRRYHLLAPTDDGDTDGSSRESRHT